MTEQKISDGQGLGIAGLVLGILAIPLGIIPCTFFIALIFGVVGIVLSSIALSQASRHKAAKGLIIAALVCSILGTAFAMFWGLTLGRGAKVFEKVMKKEFREEFGKEFEDAFDSFSEEMEDVLEELEEDLDDEADTLEKNLEETNEESDL